MESGASNIDSNSWPSSVVNWVAVSGLAKRDAICGMICQGDCSGARATRAQMNWRNGKYTQATNTTASTVELAAPICKKEMRITSITMIATPMPNQIQVLTHQRSTSNRR